MKQPHSNSTGGPENHRYEADACRYPVLHQAICFASDRHLYQDRKYSGLPYIVHPLRVMSIVRSVSDDEDMLCAAVLHDVVEDTTATLAELAQTFNTRTVELVGWLTDVATSEQGNRKARKQIDLIHSQEAPADAQTIKLADLIDNPRSITTRDPDFARIYMAEKERLLAVLTKGNPQLHSQALKQLQTYQHNRVQEALKRG